MGLAMALLGGGVAVVGSALTAGPADARYATGGSGQYKGSIDWFEWGTPEQDLGTDAFTRTNTRTVAGEDLITTCTVSNIDGRIKAYRTGQWPGDALDELYNIGGSKADNQLVGGIANLEANATPSFDVSCKVTLGGKPVQLQGLVVADAEENSVTYDSGFYEYIEVTPGEGFKTWRLIDRMRSPGCTADAMLTVSGKTLRMENENGKACYLDQDPKGYGPMTVDFMEGATSAHIALNGHANTAVGIGVVLSTDFGDAPASYGAAGAAFEPTWTGGELKDGDVKRAHDMTMGTLVEHTPTPRLGEVIDSEGAPLYSDDARGDDTTGLADEDAIKAPGTISVTPGESYTLKNVKCQGPGAVTGWIDWNRNGRFDDGERSGVKSCTGSEVDLTWAVPKNAKEAVDAKTFLRLRIGPGALRAALNAASVTSPVGLTIGGEVEDYALNTSFPHLKVEKTSNATTDSRPGDTVTYTIKATNTGKTAFTSDYPAVLMDDLAGVLDDATYTKDAAADQPGTIDYTEPVLSWTGALGAGKSVELTYTVKLKAGGDGTVRNVAWEPKDPENPEPPACESDDGFDPITGEPCSRHDYDLPRLSIDKTVDRTEVHKAGEKVTYTVTVKNEGPGDYTSKSPATFTDDLSDVLDDATYNDDASATAGSASVKGSQLSWSGVLKAGESATITYSVTYKGGGNYTLKNAACVPLDAVKPGEKPCDSTDTPASGLDVSKKVSAKTAVAGTILTYTVTFANHGKLAAAVDHVDRLEDVLDDAEVTSEPVASDPALTVSKVENGRITVKGSVPANTTYTVTYQVTVKADGTRGNDRAVNFVVPSDTEPPDECLPDNPACTDTPVTPGEPTAPVTTAPPSPPPSPSPSEEITDTPLPTPDQPDKPLPRTGADGVVPLGIAAVALIVLGGAVVLARRLRATQR